MPYAEPRAPYHRKCAFDVSDYGLGNCASSLELGEGSVSRLGCGSGAGLTTVGIRFGAWTVDDKSRMTSSSRRRRHANSPEPSSGCDCLCATPYFDAVLNDSQGQPVVLKKAVCMHEEDHGLISKVGRAGRK